MKDHRPSFTYALYNRQALSLPERIHIYLRTYKSDRSAAILEYYLALTPRNGTYSDTQREQRDVFENRALNIKAS